MLYPLFVMKVKIKYVEEQYNLQILELCNILPLKTANQ